MAKHKKKNYYAILSGHISPAICASWGVASALVSGYKGAKHQGFPTLNAAISFLEKNGHPKYKFFCGSAEGERAPGKGDPVYYAVANGENVGVYKCYQGGAQGEVTKYPHSCHKAFKSREDAEAFIKEYKITADLVEKKSVEEDITAVLSNKMSQLNLGIQH